MPLDAVIRCFDSELAARGLDPKSICLVTDGQLAIRQCLFPEATRKGITLPSYYYRFHDLRKEFASAYPDSTATNVEEMLKGKAIDTQPNEISRDRFGRCARALRALRTRVPL